MFQFINQWSQVLTADVIASALVLPVSDASALTFGSATDKYRLTLLKSGTNQYEIIEATGKTGNNLDVIRAQESTAALDFLAGDTVEIRVTAGQASGWAQLEEALSLDSNFDIQTALAKAIVSVAADIKTANGNKLANVTAIKDYVDQSSPVGMITAWNPGFYTNGANGGFTLTLGGSNSIAAANAYLNPKGWYVCDGAALNLSNSPIFNGAGRQLPNLTDDRFLNGSTYAGGAAGSNTMLDHTHGCSTESQAHSHYVNFGTVTTGTQSSYHTHNYDRWNALAGQTAAGGNYGGNWAQTGTDNGTHYHYLGLGGTQSGSESANHNHSIGSGYAATATENRPRYLSTFFIIKVL